MQTRTDIWHELWFRCVLVMVTVAVRVYWGWRLPPAGYAVTAMAVIAGIMALLPEMTGYEKSIWFVLLMLFMSTELKAINHERQEQSDNFKTIVQGLQTTIKQGTQEIQQLQSSVDHLQRLERTQQDIERQNRLIHEAQIPSLKQHALTVARNINSFLHARESELAEESYGVPVPDKYRAVYDNETVKQYRQTLMPEAISITHEFEKRKIYWWHTPYRFTCGSTDRNNLGVGDIEYCATQLERAAERLPK